MAGTDLISRQDAIDALLKLGDSYFGEDEVKRGIAQSQRIIYELPSAERVGKWIMKSDPYGFFDKIPVCSECGCTTKMREKTNYCPNCGARMVSEDEY